eukprot:2629660-Pleurochrysis_carterae.AAC.1
MQWLLRVSLGGEDDGHGWIWARDFCTLGPGLTSPCGSALASGYLSAVPGDRSSGFAKSTCRADLARYEAARGVPDQGARKRRLGADAVCAVQGE